MILAGFEHILAMECSQNKPQKAHFEPFWVPGPECSQNRPQNNNFHPFWPQGWNGNVRVYMYIHMKSMCIWKCICIYVRTYEIHMYIHMKIHMYICSRSSKHTLAKRSMKTYSWRLFWDVFWSIVWGGTGKLNIHIKFMCIYTWKSICIYIWNPYVYTYEIYMYIHIYLNPMNNSQFVLCVNPKMVDLYVYVSFLPIIIDEKLCV